MRCCSHHGHHKHSGRNLVTLMFLIQASPNHYDSTILRLITHDTLKLYGHEATVQPKKSCYTWKQRSITFQLTHLCDRIFIFLLAALCLLASISDLFLHVHHHRIDNLVTLHAIPSTISWWWCEPEDWIHPKSTVLNGSCNFLFNWMCVHHLPLYHPTQL
jgi:hypothetical protein